VTFICQLEVATRRFEHGVMQLSPVGVLHTHDELRDFLESTPKWVDRHLAIKVDNLAWLH
jgi:hypothetical protein